MYHETHGLGEWVVLLHGGAGSTGMFADLTRVPSENRKVVAADLQAHGRTAGIGRPLRYELMVDDVAALVDHLGLARVDLMGYSLGGGLALRTTIQHPEMVRKLVLVAELLQRDYDWSGDIAENLRSPTMLAVGDADSVRTAHAVEFFELLEGGKKDAGWDCSGVVASRLCVLPGVTHYDIFNSPALISATKAFLDVA